jgi:hypothetical protein
MSKIQELEEILKNDVLKEIEDEIKALKKALLKQSNNRDLKEELNYIEDVKKYYDEVINYIEKGLLKEEEAIDILKDLEDMRADDEDEV